MRSTILLAALGFASCASSPLAPLLQGSEPIASASSDDGVDGPSGEGRHRFATLIGARSLDDDEVWDPVVDQFAAGIEYSKVGSSGFGIELGMIGSTAFKDRVSTNVDVKAALLEIFGGLRKEFNWGKWRPTFGVGGALLAAAVDNDSGGDVADDQDISSGLYAHGGLFYDFSSSSFIGLDFRVMTATEIEFEALQSDADYQQLMLVFGVRF